MHLATHLRIWGIQALILDDHEFVALLLIKDKTRLRIGDRPDILILPDFLIEDVQGKAFDENSCSFLLDLPVDLLCSIRIAINFAVFDEGLELGYMLLDHLLVHLRLWEIRLSFFTILTMKPL